MSSKNRQSDWEGYVARGQGAYGSSVEFEFWLRRYRPDLLVPENEIVLVEGCVGWTPWHEAKPPAGSQCGLCGGGINTGSLRYCPKCSLSGHEARLREQRLLAGTPAPDPKIPDGKGGLG